MFIAAFLLLDSLAFWQTWLVSGACSTINASAFNWHGYLWLNGCKGKSRTQHYKNPQLPHYQCRVYTITMLQKTNTTATNNNNYINNNNTNTTTNNNNNDNNNNNSWVTLFNFDIVPAGAGTVFGQKQ